MDKSTERKAKIIAVIMVVGSLALAAIIVIAAWGWPGG